MKFFEFNIYTSQKKEYTGSVVSLIIPTETGYVGVMADHAPLAANVVPGKITIREESGKTTVLEFKNKGFLEVLKNKATILVQ